ncbi:MAG: SagB/ThcOx family dehydrogenase [Candidatus Eisenbacteria bacterium]|nr:SagB/ThcOx family dehydrogenase [Candidatus Eisenbacteria bacterium]
MTKEIGRRFMEETRYDRLGVSEQQRGVPQPPLVRAVEEGEGRIALPALDSFRYPPLDFTALVTGRKSLRSYAESPLTREELSFLLWCAQGVKEIRQGVATIRTVPSAGARHAFETYLSVHRVEGLAPGLYRFDALGHGLVRLREDGDFGAALAEACFGQSFVERSAVVFAWAAVAHRMTWRYGERGYRYLHLDAGHVCQNLYLAAEVIGGGACGIAAFDDDAVNRLLGLDGEREFAIYLAAAGKRVSGP